LSVSRWLQFAAAALLCGVPAFFVYAIPQPSGLDVRWARGLVLGAALLGVGAAIFMLLAESAEMSGDAASAFKFDVVWSVLSGTYFGAVWSMRIVLLAMMGVLAVALPERRGSWMVLALAGALTAASLAWLGHGREGEGWLGTAHLVADILHVLAASIWIGALVALLYLLRRAALGGGEDAVVAARGLSSFSGVGPLVVAVLIVTGIVNAWALTAPHSIGEALATDYARLLLVKLGLFALMLALAAQNRVVLTARLNTGMSAQAATKAAITALQRNIVVETGLAALVLVAVAVLGVMEPPSAL
jgi:putative copper resistance protein D